jgi:hypothetical protein
VEEASDEAVGVLREDDDATGLVLASSESIAIEKPRSGAPSSQRAEMA